MISIDFIGFIGFIGFITQEKVSKKSFHTFLCYKDILHFILKTIMIKKQGDENI